MEEKKKRKSPLSYPRYLSALISVIIVAVLLALLRVWAVYRDFEPDVQYFRFGSIPAVAFTGAAVALAVFAFFLPLFVDRDKFMETAPAVGTRTRFLAFFSAIALLAYAFFEGKDFVSRAHTDIISASEFTSRFQLTSGICVLLSVGLAAYLIIVAVARPGGRRAAALVGCLGVGFLIFRLLFLYFDTSSPINSPIKTLDQMANSAALLYLAGELRLMISDPRPRFALQTGPIAFALLLPSSLSQLFCSFTGKLALSTSKTLFALFELAFALYIVSRVVALAFRRGPLPAPAEEGEPSEPDETAEPADSPEEGSEEAPEEVPGEAAMADGSVEPAAGPAGPESAPESDGRENGE